VHRPENRSVPRFFLTPALQAFAGGRAVRVVDLCLNGARLEHNEPFPRGTDITLAIRASDREVSVKANVLWCQLDSLQLSATHDRYLTGVAFRSNAHAVAELIDELRVAKAVIPIEDERNFDRYRLNAPITASFGPLSPVSLLDLSMRGAKIEAGSGIEAGMTGQLIFQVDVESGPIDVAAEVKWVRPTVEGGFHAGLLIAGHDETMADAIQRLCRRGEAQIDLNALRRKFDALRAESLAAASPLRA
jgi:hypothetical protein